MLFTTLLTLLFACGGAPTAQPVPEPAPEATTQAVPQDVPAERSVEGNAPAPDATCLDHADLQDGTADKVIHRCANCGLGMDGSADHASTVGEFTAHACSASCKAAFDADPAGVLARSCKH